MDKLPFRQIHLDFHTSEHMPNVGGMFSEENFENALKIGHISSITLFSKCHHGWSYHPTKVNEMHPTLKTNLLERQLDVCKKMGVRAQIYISAGLDERKAVKYPHFRNIRRGNENTLLGAHWHGLCLNNDEYLSMLCAEVAEVMEMFGGKFDGVFMDICNPSPCVCPICINSMLELGLNPENPIDVEKHRKIVYAKYTKAINQTVAKYDANMPVFHNCGEVPKNDRERVYSNTAHIELESLPTGGWGYDHFPLSAAYMRVFDKEFLGMTGKFHKSWGEFGGYKHPNALRYEAALSLANGAKISVGDQLHPLGMFDEATYKLIGAAYSEVEKKEEWCSDVKAVADIAIFTTYTEETKNTCPDIGANRILLEGKYLYNIIDNYCDFGEYKLIIFPDSVIFDDELAKKVNGYIANGGKILLSGVSGTMADGRFFKNFGLEFCGTGELDATYLVPTYDMQPNGIAAYLMYGKGYIVKNAENVKVTAKMQDSYFNRSFRKFCSHRNTPNNPESCGFGAGLTDNIGYIAWNVFSEYGEHGAYHAKRIVTDMLDALLKTEKTLETTLASNGVATLMRQPKKNRLVNHLLYAVTKLRGNTEVIEDAISVSDVKVKIRLSEKPKRVYIAPENADIAYTYENGVLEYDVPKFTLHTMVVIDE